MSYSPGPSFLIATMSAGAIVGAGARFPFDTVADQGGSKISLDGGTGILTMQPSAYLIVCGVEFAAGGGAARSYALYDETNTAVVTGTQARIWNANAANAEMGRAILYRQVAISVETEFSIIEHDYAVSIDVKHEGTSLTVLEI